MAESLVVQLAVCRGRDSLTCEKAKRFARLAPGKRGKTFVFSSRRQFPSVPGVKSVYSGIALKEFTLFSFPSRVAALSLLLNIGAGLTLAKPSRDRRRV